MGKVILLCGKICSGKSTYAKQIKEAFHAVILSCDDLMLTFFEEQLGEKHEPLLKKAKNYLYQLTEQIVQTDTNVILDFGFWNHEERDDLRRYFQAKHIDTELHYVKVDQEVWLQQIEHRNNRRGHQDTRSYFVDEHMIKLFTEAFQEPTEDEIDVVIHNTKSKK